MKKLPKKKNHPILVNYLLRRLIEKRVIYTPDDISMDYIIKLIHNSTGKILTKKEIDKLLIDIDNEYYMNNYHMGWD